ncbi:MAG: hypothetical protein HYS98_01015 [Deltaproteobacteria bacterium]|nr:hypothetical protein [Deltaproteobacteria bacterium]
MSLEMYPEKESKFDHILAITKDLAIGLLGLFMLLCAAVGFYTLVFSDDASNRFHKLDLEPQESYLEKKLLETK